MCGHAEQVEEEIGAFIMEEAVHAADKDQQKKDAKVYEEVRLVLIEDYSGDSEQNLEQELDDQ